MLVSREPMDARALDVDAVVHAGEQSALVADRDPGAREPVDGPADLRSDLVRMVEVEVHPDRVVLREHLAELVVNPLGQEDRDPRADPDDLDVGDLAEPADDLFEQLRGEGQAVAARDQDIPDLGRPAQVFELGLVIAAVEVLGRVADGPAPGAIPAVARALRRYEHEDAVGAAVDEARGGRVAGPRGGGPPPLPGRPPAPAPARDLAPARGNRE